MTRYRHWRAQGNSDQICNIKHVRVFLAELRRKVPVNDDDLIPANLPRQALRNEFFALLAVGRQPRSGPETGFSEVMGQSVDPPRNIW
jgi:hypothetical protein